MICDESEKPIRLGVCGLGRGFMLMLPTLLVDPRVHLSAAADPRPEARERFEREFARPGYSDIAALCADSSVDAIYIATPHELHAEHAIAAAQSGKAILLEKPMAVSLQQCDAICAAVARSGVICVVGPSHSFDEPYRYTAELLASGDYGSVRHIAASNYTDFQRRPRWPTELASGSGGAVLNQGPHQIDIVRLLIDDEIRRVQAFTGNWEGNSSDPGAYSALLEFSRGATATLTYNGYGHYDSSRCFSGSGELGHPLSATGKKRSAHRHERLYGPLGLADATAPLQHEHFGEFRISCDRALLYPRPDGVEIHCHGQTDFHPLALSTPSRYNVISELKNAMRAKSPPRRDANWGRTTVQICEAILDAGRQSRAIEFTPRAASYPI